MKEENTPMYMCIAQICVFSDALPLSQKLFSQCFIHQQLSIAHYQVSFYAKIFFES